MGRVSAMAVAAAVVLTALFDVITSVAANTIHPPSWAILWIWGVVVILPLLITFFQHRQRSRPAPAVVDLDTATSYLAHMVGQLLQEQERFWQIHDPYPLPVRWTLGRADLTDHWDNIRGAQPGQSAGPLALDGQLDQITGVYQRIPSGRLVVLGKDGAGKTILAGQLVAGLLKLETRTPRDPVPVMFNLDTWNPSVVPLETWLITQLIENHPKLTGPDPTDSVLDTDLVADKLFAAGRILPVLDDFDQIARGLRSAALEAMSRNPTIPLVLISRPDEYHDAVASTRRLTAAAVITLADLTVTDLACYFKRASLKTDPTRWAPVLDALTAQPSTPAAAVLTQALSTPLMVYLARTIYEDQNPTDLLDPNLYRIAGNELTPADIKEHLLKAFIPAVYGRLTSTSTGKVRRRRFDNRTEALRWHTYLATHLHDDLAWWRLRDTIPRTARILTTALTVGLTAGAATGLMWLVAGIAFGLPGLTNVLAIGMGYGLLCGLSNGIFGVRRTGPRPQRAHFQLQGRISALRKASGLGFVAGLASGLAGWLGFGLAFGLSTGIAIWVAIGLVLLIEELADAPKVDTVFSPIDFLHMDRSRTFAIIITVGLAFGLVLGITFWIAFGTVGIAPGLTFGLVLGLPVGLGLGLGTAWGQWLTCTRLWLPATGRLPRSIIDFISDAHQRGVLRQTGGVYRYRHARLRDHLATRPPHNDSTLR